MDRPVFHAGEVAMQRAAGFEARLREVGPRVIRDHLPESHREFFEQLPTLFVGGADERLRPWASVLAGLPGFVETPDAEHLRVDAWPHDGDPLAAQLRRGAQLGLLGLEPQTRRRNRANGTVVAVDDGRGFLLRVAQSFGNCPKYIQAREPSWSERSTPAPPTRTEGAALSPRAAAIVATADTFFIASAAPGEGADVSHRGGRPGFVRVDAAPGGTVLTFPDFAGNFFFNTLGNIAVHPFAGLLFVDHETGGVLQLTGRARVIAGGPEVAAVAGAERLVRLEVDEGRWSPAVVPLRWSPPVFAAQFAAAGHR